MNDIHADTDEETREGEATHVLDEARMVLPGIQALFGFQLVAVVSNRFPALPATDQRIHLLSLMFVVVAIALIMTPAAYHRQAERHRVSRRFINMASRLMTLAMVPLMVGICTDLYVIAHAILGNAWASAAIAIGFSGLFVALWFVFPQLRKRRR